MRSITALIVRSLGVWQHGPELCEDLLDRVQVRRVGRQEGEASAIGGGGPGRPLLFP